MEPRTSKLSQKDYTKIALRSYLLQNALSYTFYQGVSYLHTIMPALKKIYKDEPEKLEETAGANLEFYNTNPQMLPFVTSMQLAMYDNGQSITDTRSTKTVLMGLLSGIGDSATQFGIAPLFSTIFAGLAMDGPGLAPMGFWFLMLISMLIIGLLMDYLGFKLGTSVIETLSDKIGRTFSAANIVGVTVIAALAVSFVKANTAIKYSHHVEPGEKQVIAIQDILDKTMPKMLPVILAILVFYLTKKRNQNTYRLLILLSVIEIAASVLGILAQQTRVIKNKIFNLWKIILISVFVTSWSE